MHYEDADFCWRVRRAGFSIHGVPDARLWHKVSQSGRQLGPHITYYRTRNRIWFYATHRRGLARIWALAYVIPHEMVRCSRAMLNDDHDVAASCWKGIRHGLRGQLGK